MRGPDRARAMREESGGDDLLCDDVGDTDQLSEVSSPNAGTLAEHVALLPTPAAQEPGGTAERHLYRKNRLMGRTDDADPFIETALTPVGMDSV